jgi:hypothetical protein
MRWRTGAQNARAGPRTEFSGVLLKTMAVLSSKKNDLRPQF